MPKLSKKAALSGLCGSLASFVWGASFLYWHELKQLSPIDLISFRILFSLLTLLLLLPFTSQLKTLRTALTEPKTWVRYGLAGLVVAINWGTFVFASVHGRPFDASLGYFLVPLLNIGLGVLLLKEKLTALQYLALSFAVLGVLNLIGQPGELWVSLPLTIACSFGIYGYLKKTGHLDALSSMYPETIALTLPAILWLSIGSDTGFSLLWTAPMKTVTMLAGTGVLSVAPLLMFTFAARRLRLSTVGFLQYLNPLTQFVIGLLFFNRILSTAAAITFSLICTGLALVSWDSLRKAGK